MADAICEKVMRDAPNPATLMEFRPEIITISDCIIPGKAWHFFLQHLLIFEHSSIFEFYLSPNEENFSILYFDLYSSFYKF